MPDPRPERTPVGWPAARRSAATSSARIYCSEKVLVPISTGRTWVAGRLCSHQPVTPTASRPSRTRPLTAGAQRRSAIPRWHQPSAPSTMSASAAAATQPSSTCCQSCNCNPAKIRSPRLSCPTIVANVAAPMVHTAAVRTPPITTGAASESSTWKRRWLALMPMARAASRTLSGTAANPPAPPRSSGSSA